MANYNAYSRTNYFKVTDSDRLMEIVDLNTETMREAAKMVGKDKANKIEIAY